MADIKFDSLGLRGKSSGSVTVGEVAWFQDNGPLFESEGQIFLRSDVLVDSDQFPDSPDFLKINGLELVNTFPTVNQPPLYIDKLNDAYFIQTASNIFRLDDPLNVSSIQKNAVSSSSVSWRVNDKIYRSYSGNNVYNFDSSYTALQNPAYTTFTVDGSAIGNIKCAVRYQNSTFLIGSASSNLYVASIKDQTPTVMTSVLSGGFETLGANLGILTAAIFGNTLYIFNGANTSDNNGNVAIFTINPVTYALTFDRVVSLWNNTTPLLVTGTRDSTSCFLSGNAGQRFIFDSVNVKLTSTSKLARLNSELEVEFQGTTGGYCLTIKNNQAAVGFSSMSIPYTQSFNSLNFFVKLLDEYLFFWGNFTQVGANALNVYRIDKKRIGHGLLLTHNQTPTTFLVGYLRIQ